ncbi:MAG TPA: molybdate ABC transporter permease subunit [Gemmatimonadota bacterium]|jgi:molybdate transport system permease protein
MSPELLNPLRLSLLVALCSTVLVGLFGTVLAYVFARKRFPGRGWLDLLVTLPLVLPPTVTGYYLILLFGRRGLLGGPLFDATGWTVTFTWIACVIAATIMALPLMVKTAQSAIASVDREYEEAAITLGKTELQVALRITLPLARKGILAGLVLAFARALGEFGATLMLAGNIPGRTTTMPLAIYTAVSTGEDAAARTLVLLLTVVSATVLIVANRLGQTRW